jgi:hypothetical protein
MVHKCPVGDCEHLDNLEYTSAKWQGRGFQNICSISYVLALANDLEQAQAMRQPDNPKPLTSHRSPGHLVCRP